MLNIVCVRWLLTGIYKNWGHIIHFSYFVVKYRLGKQLYRSEYMAKTWFIWFLLYVKSYEILNGWKNTIFACYYPYTMDHLDKLIWISFSRIHELNYATKGCKKYSWCLTNRDYWVCDVSNSHTTTSGRLEFLLVLKVY